MRKAGRLYVRGHISDIVHLRLPCTGRSAGGGDEADGVRQESNALLLSCKGANRAEKNANCTKRQKKAVFYFIISKNIL